MFRQSAQTSPLLCLFFILGMLNKAYPVDEAHEHRGILTPYTQIPETIELSKRDHKQLNKGKAVFKKQLIGDEKRAVVLFKVKANQNLIWSVIKDFANYPLWIEDIKSTKLYKQEAGVLYVRFDAENKYAGKTSWFAKHDYPIDNEGWGSWTLDYDHLSDLDDSVGYWQVIPDAVDPASSLVTYSATLKLKSKAPSFIVSIIVKARLKQATLWVREEAEQRMQNTHPASDQLPGP